MKLQGQDGVGGGNCRVGEILLAISSEKLGNQN